MADHNKVFIAAYLILKRGNEVFLLRRANTGYEDGNYSLPAGHVEEGEQPSQGAIREAKEEIGVDALAQDIHCVHVMHRLDDRKGGKEYDDFFFMCEKWDGEPKNIEPEKCDECGWFLLDALPPNTIPYLKVALESVENNQFYSER